MKRAAIGIALAFMVSGCAISVSDLKSGQYRGTVTRKSVDRSSRMASTGPGQWEMIWVIKYFIDVGDEQGNITRLEVSARAYDSVQEGTRLPLGGDK